MTGPRISDMAAWGAEPLTAGAKVPVALNGANYYFDLGDWVSRTAHAFDAIPSALHAGIIAGTDTTDVSSYLQEVLDTGYLLRLPEVGLLWIASSLQVPSGGGIVGGGMSSRIKAKADFGNIPLIRNATALPASLAARDAGLLFRDFMLDGNKANNSTATEFSSGFWLNAVDGAHFANVLAKDCKGDGFTFLYAIDGVGTTQYDVGCSNITGFIRSETCSRQGVALVCAEGCDLYVYDTGTSLFSLDLEGDNVDNYIRDNRIRLVSVGAGVAGTESSGGFGVASPSGDTRNNVIEFLVRDSGGVGGAWRNAERLTLRGTIDGAVSHGLIGIDGGDAASTVTLDVRVHDAGGAGLACQETAGALYDGRAFIDGCLIGVSLIDADGGNLNLRVTDSSNVGVRLTDVTGMTFPNMKVSGSSSHNVQLSGASSGNRFPNMMLGSHSFGTGFIEEDTSNDNRATNARIASGGDGKVTLVGASSSVEMEPIKFSGSWNPGSIADGDSESKTFTVTGAALGDKVDGSLNVSLKGCVLGWEVSAADTVKGTINNNTGSAQDIDDATAKGDVTRVY